MEEIAIRMACRIFAYALAIIAAIFLVAFIIAFFAGALPAQVLIVSPQPQLAPTSTSEPPKPVVSVEKQYTPAEASVIVRNARGKEVFQCSGTAIDEHTVLTCWHILRETDFLNLTVNGEPARALRFDAKSDVALLHTQSSLKPVRVAGKPIAVGEACVAYGYEYTRAGKLWKFPANIVQVNRYRGFPNVSTRGRDPVLSGRSGGGLFNSKDELVGVCSARDGVDGLYCGLEAVRAILGHNPDKKPDIVSVKPKPSKDLKNPDIVSQWMQDPNCVGGNCPLIKKQAPNTCPSGTCRTAPASPNATGSKRLVAPSRTQGFFQWGRR